MADIHDNRLATVLMLLGLTEDKKGLVLYALHLAEELTLNYCNIDEIPPGLSHTVSRMAMTLYQNEDFGEDEGSGGSAVAGEITEIKEGDTTVKFSSGGSSSGSGTTGKYTDELLGLYRPQLNRYRKVKFT